MVRDLFQSGYDSRQFYQSFLEHLRNMVVVKTCKNSEQLINLLPEELELLRAQVKGAETGSLQRLFEVWLKAENEIYRSSMPHIVLEMLLLRMVYLKGLLPLDDALTKLTQLEKRLFNGKGVVQGRVTRKEMSSGDSELPPVEEDVSLDPHGDPDVGDHNRNWDGFLQFAKKEKPLLAALLDHGRLLQMEEKMLLLGFPPNSIFMESAQDKENAAQIKKLCEEFFGRKLKIKVTALQKEASPPAPVQSPRQELNGVEHSDNDALRNPLVDEALSMFNGKIVEVREEGDVGSERELPKI
jgi:DNA polymerase-3 subunit gamma/tau